MALQDEGEAEKLAADPFYKLEHDVGDKQKAMDAVPVITQLQVGLAVTAALKLGLGR